MARRHTIGGLAAAAGIPTSTVRYYERSGLLNPPERTDSNYRIYDQESVDRLRFIRAAQATGLTLEDIKTLLRYRDGHIAPCQEIRVLIEKRLEHVKIRMQELKHVDRVLKSYLEICRQAEEDEPCEVLGKLDGEAHRKTASASEFSSRSRKSKNIS